MTDNELQNCYLSHSILDETTMLEYSHVKTSLTAFVHKFLDSERWPYREAENGNQWLVMHSFGIERSSSGFTVENNDSIF